MVRCGPGGAPVGRIVPRGPVTHREELGGEDSLEFSCTGEVEKLDRLLWRDPEDGRWREHVVARVEEEAGRLHVLAESSLSDLLAGVIVETRLAGATADEALAAVLDGSGWGWEAEGALGEASCLLYHRSRLEAVRRVCGLVGAEAEARIEVGPRGVESRSVAACARLGAWRGARLTYRRGCARVSRTVLEDEVCTALFGWGAGLPVLDGDGSWTGGYRRKLDFSSVNGVKWIGDEEARERWGLPMPDGTRAHRFGQVTFAGETDPARLLERTRAELARLSSPHVTYTAERAVDPARVPVGLGDDVAVTDLEPPAPPRGLFRVTARVREIGRSGIAARYTLGRVEATTWSAASESVPVPLTHRVPFPHDVRERGNGGRYGTRVAEVHGGVQAEGGAALPREGRHLRRDRAGARSRRRQHIGLGQEGRHRPGVARGQPLQGGRGEPQAPPRG